MDKELSEILSQRSAWIWDLGRTETEALEIGTTDFASSVLPSHFILGTRFLSCKAGSAPMAIDPSASPAALNVLAVEDDPSVAHAIAAVLSGPGCHLTLASSAAEGLDAIVSHQCAFDVVITDNSMPEGRGGDLVRRLRRDNFVGRVVVLSAYISPEEELEYKNLGVDVMLPKPFRIVDLRQAVGL